MLNLSHRILALVLIAGLALAACGGGSSSATQAGDTAASDATASEMPAESTEATDSNNDGGTVDGMGTDPVLASRLPTSVDGQKIEVATFSYANVPFDAAAWAVGDADATTKWLKDQGKTWKDVSWATATAGELGSGDANAKSGMLIAFRVTGASESTLGGFFKLLTGSDMGTETTKSIGGKNVQVFEIPMTSISSYQWVSGDTAYWISAAQPKEFAEAWIAAIK